MKRWLAPRTIGTSHCQDPPAWPGAWNVLCRDLCRVCPTPSACQSSQNLGHLCRPSPIPGFHPWVMRTFVFSSSLLMSLLYQKPGLFLLSVGKCIWLLSELRCLQTCWHLSRQCPLPVHQLVWQNVLGMLICFSRCWGQASSLLPAPQKAAHLLG